ncbi:MAG: GNAT family N-acetyltransferase [Mycobacteriales bacterium]
MTLAPPDRAVLERLWQLYRHDLSEFRGTLPGADGAFPADRLDASLEDPARQVHLVVHGGAPAGFAVVQRLPDGRHGLYEFFVVRAARRQGLARETALALLAVHPGPWQIAFQEENPGAARLWRRLAQEVAGEAVVEERRAVPGKPHLPPDVFLLFDVPPGTG